MKELLAKQGLNKENSHNCSHPNGQAWNGNANNQQGNQRGQGRHNTSGQVHCYNCQGYGHMVKECQNPRVPWGGGQQVPVPPTQGLNAYMQNFVPVQYFVSILQPVVLQQVPQYVQSNMAPVQQTRLPTVPIIQAGQGMVPAAAAEQLPLN